MVVLSISEVREDPTILGKHTGQEVYVVDKKKRSIEAIVEVKEIVDSITLPAEFTGVKQPKGEE